MMEENKFQREVLDRLVRLETKIDMQDYKTISEKVEETHAKCLQNEQEIAHNSEEIEKLNAINKWIITSVIGAVVLAVINILVKNAW